jgi:hypothetical protein
VNWPGSCLVKRVPKFGLTLSACALTAALFAGCNTIEKTRQTLANTPKIYAVSSEAAPFYSHGPQQGNGPDRTLPRDTLVKLIRPSFGYSKVQVIGESQEGYVASEDIQVASPSLVEKATATPPPVAAASTPAGEQFNLDSSDPRLKAPPEQLPAPDLPASADPGPQNPPQSY